jgi:hypothetical protein
MQVDFNHPFERNMCEVHYASGSAIGYRFDASFILTASEDLKLTGTKFGCGEGDRRACWLHTGTGAG